MLIDCGKICMNRTRTKREEIYADLGIAGTATFEVPVP
jgi:hypothetical protein